MHVYLVDCTITLVATIEHSVKTTLIEQRPEGQTVICITVSPFYLVCGLNVSLPCPASPAATQQAGVHVSIPYYYYCYYCCNYYYCNYYYCQC